MSVGKVKNILKGYAGKFNITYVTFFNADDTVSYSGSYEVFMDTKESDLNIWEEWKRILNSDCSKCISFNNSKLFFFLETNSINREENSIKYD